MDEAEKQTNHLQEKYVELKKVGHRSTTSID